MPDGQSLEKPVGSESCEYNGYVSWRLALEEQDGALEVAEGVAGILLYHCCNSFFSNRVASCNS